MSEIIEFIKAEIQANKERFKLFIPVLFGVGIGLYFLLPDEPSKWLTLGIIEGLILLAILFRYHRRVLKILFVLAIITAGFADVQIQTIYRASRHNSDFPSEEMYLRGYIANIGYNFKGNQRLTFDGLEDFEDNKINGTYRITLRGRQYDLKVGDCVEYAGRIRSLPKAAIVGGYQFDRKGFYEGFSGSGYAVSPLFQTECKHGVAPKQSLLDIWREQIRITIFRVLPFDEAAITTSLITGERGFISEQVYQNYRDSGLAHFLSISGLHMTMLAGLMFFLVRLIIALIPPLSLRFDSKKISAVAAMILSAVYLGLSGADVPAMRAFLMTFIVLLGVLTNRRAISMYTIAIAALVVLAIYPQALVGASFQMSFAAVVCLIGFYERCSYRLGHFVDKSSGNILVKSLKILLLYFVGVLVTDFVASIATLPFAVYHFNRIALYTSIGNMTAAPIIGFIIMPFLLLSLLLMPFGLANLPLKITGFGIAQVNEITAWVSSMDGASYLMVSEPLWGLLLIVFGGLWLCILQTKIRHMGWIAILLGALSVFTVTKPDMLVSADAKVIAIKDNYNRMVILPSRGQKFTKQQLREKTASQPLNKVEAKKLRQIYQGKETDKDWLDLSCDEESCTYKNRLKITKGGEIFLDNKKIDLAGSEGLAVYLYATPKIITIRETIGNRFWNQE